MARAIVTRACAWCGREYQTKESNPRKYCETACYREWQRSDKFVPGRPKSYSGDCAGCGKPVYGRSASTKRNGEKSDKVYCNRDCYDAHRAEIQKQYIAENTRKCEGCDKLVAPPSVGSVTPKYCCMACRRAHKQPKPVVCVNCGCEFSAIKWMKGRSKATRVSHSKTCSDACLREFYRTNEARKEKISKAFSGEKHPNWQGGPTSSRSRAYRGPGWTRIANKIRKRDKNTCQHCGVTEAEVGRKLEVHHITPFCQFAGDNRKANRPSNLVTLCKSCHMKAEWKWRQENEVQISLLLDGANKQYKPKYPSDLSGLKFGDLVALERVENPKGHSAKWLTRCNRCGSDKTFWRQALVDGKAKDCGCRLREHREKRRAEKAAIQAARKVMPRYWWHVDGVYYRTLELAANASGVSEGTIENWCKGPKRKGGRGEPRKGCWAISRHRLDMVPPDQKEAA